MIILILEEQDTTLMSAKIKRILVSQPAPVTGKSPYITLSEQYGFEVDFKPFFSIQTLGTREFRDQKVNILDHTAIIFTSRTAIDHFFKLTQELRLTMPEDMKYFCHSAAIASYLQKYIVYRKRKVFYHESGQAAQFHALLLKHNKETYFIPGIEGLKEDIVAVLDSKKIPYSTSAIYRSVPNGFTKEEIDGYDLLIFFSPNGVTSLRSNYPEYKQNKQLLACFGEATASALRENGLEVNIEAPSPEFPSMTAALEHYIKKHK